MSQLFSGYGLVEHVFERIRLVPQLEVHWNIVCLGKRLKLKRTILDTWSTREKLSLASLVLHSGDQNWSCVSRNIRLFAEPNRPPDWFSPRNCAQQYASLLENVETPKRKKRVAGSNEKSEVETPVESIVRKLKADRIEELKKKIDEIRMEYLRVKNASNSIITGEADDKIPEMLQEIEDEKKKKELEKEAHIKWLKEREERKIELERAWKPGSRLMNIRRASSMSEPSSEADSPLSEPLNVDVLEEYNISKPTPTSPLLTSLLKSPSTVGPVQPASQNSSILHSAITSPHRGSSPTIASLLSSSPGLPGNFNMPPSNVSSNLKNFVSNAISNSFNEEHKTVPQSPSQEHLGPPPPYSQATEYLQKQRAEQLAAQTQSNTVRVKTECGVSSPAADNNTSGNVSTPPTNNQSHPVTARRSSVKGRRLDMQASEESEADESTNTQDTSKVSSPVREKDSKRLLHNTPDHDYVETPVKGKDKESASPVKTESKVQKKLEMDIFEFDESKEKYDKINLSAKDSKMSYLKSNSQRTSVRKDSEGNGQKKSEGASARSDDSKSKESDGAGSPPRDNLAGNDDDVPLRNLVKKENTEDQSEDRSDAENKVVSGSPAKEAESRRPSRNSSDGSEKREVESEIKDSKEAPKRKASTDIEDEKPSKRTTVCKENPAEKESDSEVSSDVKVAEPTGANSDDGSTERRKSEENAEQSEEEKPEDTDESEAAKDYDASSIAVDTKSEKTDLSTTEDEKSNDAAPKVYSRRRGGTSFSDSVPNSPAPITEEEKEYKAWKKVAMFVYTRLAGHKFASLFLKPITDDQAPGYSSIVRRPMDLSSVKRNIELGNIRTTAEFQRDVMLMFTNALMYNERDHHVYTMAMEMQADSKEHFQMLLQVTDENTPSRRETRTQQNSDVKIRPMEKAAKTGRPSQQGEGKAAAVAVEEKTSCGQSESKVRGSSRLPSRNPCGRPRIHEKPAAVVGRKRTFTGGSTDAPKKRLKTDE
ncbi:UNVERIFIED_CONTAM: hypothetical protein PYX00_002427 [Menopon gallinae]|uniref:Bromo domain-containing protein n=2 Tax=Menopon gallinae TaxID=328185 RepID=A0AAW2IIV3_9NEOP